MREKIEQDLDREGELNIKKIVEVVERTVDELEEFLDENSLSYNDLRRLKKAESAAKDRKTAKRILKSKIEEKRIDKRIKGLEDKIENSREVETDSSHLEIGTLKIEVKDGEPTLILDTGKKKIDLKHYHLEEFFNEDVGGNKGLGQLSSDSLETKINKFSEEYTGNRSRSASLNYESSPKLLTVQGTVPSIQNPALHQRREGGYNPDQRKKQGNNFEPSNKPDQKKNNEGIMNPSHQEKEPTGKEETERSRDLENAIKEEAERNSEEIDQEISEVEKLKNELEKEYGLKEKDLKNKDKDELEELKERLSEKEELKNELEDKYGIDPGDKDFEQLKDLKQKMEKIKEKKDELLDRYDIEEERAEGRNLKQLRDLEDNLKHRKNLRNRLRAHGFNSDQVENKNVDELEDLMEMFETKRNISEDLGLELEDKELRETDLEQLKSLKKEKKERERLISKLNDQGFEKKELKNSSTDDLRKLKSELESKNSKQQDVSHEDIKEMKDEAQDDIELLQGAVSRDEDDEKEDEIRKSYSEKLKDLLEDFQGTDNGDEDEENLKKKRILNKLDSYKDSDNVEKSVKTAQFMKAYLENTCNIRRELTYGEISEELEKQFDGQDERIKTLSRFFSQINNQIYSGNVYVENIDEIIEISQNLIRGIE